MPYAYNTFRPGAGLLPDEFPYARTKLVPLDREKTIARFSANIEIPLRPFFGSMGVAPPETLRRISSGPPRFQAGNLDASTSIGFNPSSITAHSSVKVFFA